MEGGGEGVFARHPLQKVAILLLTITVGGKATIIGTCSQLAYEHNYYHSYHDEHFQGAVAVIFNGYKVHLINQDL